MAAETQGIRIDPRLLEALSGIELRSRLLVRGLYNNRHRTADFGASTEFIEHRDYRKGDEIRSIDWRVFARTERLYVKRFEMEANMKVYFVLDTSDSMRVPPPPGLPSKLRLAATIAGAVMTMVIAQQDSAGLACIGERIEDLIPPRQGQNHLSELFQHLESPRGGGGGSFGPLLRGLASRIGARSMVFVLTDALDDLDPILDALKGLCVRGLDVTLFQTLDQTELEFPFDRMTEFRHPESGRRVVGDPIELRDRYLERLGEYLAAIETFCRKWRVDYVRLTNADDLVKLLSSHFLLRLLSRGA